MTPFEQTEMEKHLRLRGENFFIVSGGGISLETPPLTRRKLPTCHTVTKCARNTSAYAEKTPEVLGYRLLLRKHLRLRGENYFLHCLSAISIETPPLTRRKRCV